MPPKDTEISPIDKKNISEAEFPKMGDPRAAYRHQPIGFLPEVSQFLGVSLELHAGCVMQGSRCLMSSAVLLSTSSQ